MLGVISPSVKRKASRIITRGARKSQVMKSSHGRRPIHISASIVTGSLPEVMTETVILRVTLMLSKLQSDG